MLRRVVWQIGTDVSKDPSAFNFRVRQSKKIHCHLVHHGCHMDWPETEPMSSRWQEATRLRAWHWPHRHWCSFIAHSYLLIGVGIAQSVQWLRYVLNDQGIGVRFAECTDSYLIPPCSRPVSYPLDIWIVSPVLKLSERVPDHFSSYSAQVKNARSRNSTSPCLFIRYCFNTHSETLSFPQFHIPFPALLNSI